ncbi:hypothetical protein FQA47_007231 [Oryzias melastigma]|uniref:Uncharacterized protein n=1 Tax=Oryzias melastigma TaxID=30732 RepID=A0A834BPF6_ORYME|nr:hypothetical protein FQA47_007231 [Oryzias melastigma]
MAFPISGAHFGSPSSPPHRPCIRKHRRRRVKEPTGARGARDSSGGGGGPGGAARGASCSPSAASASGFRRSGPTLLHSALPPSHHSHPRLQSAPPDMERRHERIH